MIPISESKNVSLLARERDQFFISFCTSSHFFSESHLFCASETTSPNKRTLYNFPMQSGGAEMLRHATWKLCEAGIVPVMLVHDGILFELENREQVEHAKDIMRAAGTDRNK
jgi:hypothetical protein